MTLDKPFSQALVLYLYLYYSCLEKGISYFSISQKDMVAKHNSAKGAIYIVDIASIQLNKGHREEGNKEKGKVGLYLTSFLKCGRYCCSAVAQEFPILLFYGTCQRQVHSLESAISHLTILAPAFSLQLSLHC